MKLKVKNGSGLVCKILGCCINGVENLICLKKIMSAELVQRTKLFALRVIRLVKVLPSNDVTAVVLGKQLLRSGTSVGANYRSALRGRSDKDFLSRISVAEEEADETIYWLELFIESGVVSKTKLLDLLDEANQITAILASIIITKKKNIRLAVEAMSKAKVK